MKKLSKAICAFVLSVSVGVGCGGESDESSQPELTFAFEAAPATAFSGPFPSDLLIDPESGLIRPGLLASDLRVQGFTNQPASELFERRMATRTGFGVNTVTFFPIDTVVDEASLEGKVFMVGVGGIDQGRRLNVRAFWSEEAQAVGVELLWGQYTVPGSRYAIWIETGVRTGEGTLVQPHPELVQALAGESSDVHANRTFAGVSDLMADISDGEVIMATAFSTEAPFDYVKSLLDGLDDYPLSPISENVIWDEDTQAYISGGLITGDDLAGYFGTAQAPFDNTPGCWTQGNRDAAAQLDDVDGRYTGGSFYKGVGAVINGSFKAPAPNWTMDGDQLKNVGHQLDSDGRLTWTMETLIPFTLLLCESHLDAPAELPVSIFSHGGTRNRGGVIAYASANCLNGIATISIDLPYHAGRAFPIGLADQNLVVPGGVDNLNRYTSKGPGDEGYVADLIPDGAGAVESVGKLLGINDYFDPAIAEANTLGYMLDTYMALRYLVEGDWTPFVPGLTFNGDRLFQQSNSFGTGLTLGLSALTDRFKAVVWGAATAGLMSPSALTAPDYGPLANGIIMQVLGLKMNETQLQAQSQRSPMLSIWQWLIQRSDAGVWAPLVLRHRQGPGSVSVFHTNSSWDSTLASTGQFTLTTLSLPCLSRRRWTLDPEIPDVPNDWGNSIQTLSATT